MGEILPHLHKNPITPIAPIRYRMPLPLAFLSLGAGLLAGAASAQSNTTVKPAPLGTPAAFGQTGGVMPRGAFLRSPAKSVKVLNKELDDPIVMGRYAKLFNMPPALVRLALADLKLQPLAEDRSMEVWYVKQTPTGEISGYRMRKVKKGTLVYALPDGTPALIQVCGNPVRIITAPPGAQADVANLPVYEPYSLVLGGESIGDESELNVATRDIAPDDFIEVSMPDVPLPVPIEPPQLLASHAKRLLALWFAPLLGAIPLAFAGGGGGGGGSNFLPLPPPGNITIVPPVFTPTPTDVPEPGASALLAAVCAGGAAFWQRRRKYARRSVSQK